MQSKTIRGRVENLTLDYAKIENYGTIISLRAKFLTIIDHRGEFTLVGSQNRREVHLERCVLDKELKLKCKRLEKELESVKKELDNLKNKLKDVNRENQRIRKLYLLFKESRQQLKESLQAALEANHEAAQRIKELERGVIGEYLRQQIDNFDIRPTKQQCKQLLETLSAFIKTEEEMQ